MTYKNCVLRIPVANWGSAFVLSWACSWDSILGGQAREWEGVSHRSEIQLRSFPGTANLTTRNPCKFGWVRHWIYLSV